jgi:ketosteroid isomerase-like protein
MNLRELNRSRIETFFDALGDRDLDAAMDCYAPGAIVEVVAPGPFAGARPATREGLEAFFRAFPEIRFEILGMLFDGDRVAVEARSTGRLANGKPYQNRYHDFFELESGRIAVFREYPTFPA